MNCTKPNICLKVIMIMTVTTRIIILIKPLFIRNEFQIENKFRERKEKKIEKKKFFENVKRAREEIRRPRKEKK